MKKTKKTLLTAAILTAAMNLSSCNGGGNYDPSSEAPQEVYGPPVTEVYTQIQEETTYDPSAETPQDVYGPPTDEITKETEPYNPADDNVAVVYGPPTE